MFCVSIVIKYEEKMKTVSQPTFLLSVCDVNINEKDEYGKGKYSTMVSAHEPETFDGVSFFRSNNFFSLSVICNLKHSLKFDCIIVQSTEEYHATTE